MTLSIITKDILIDYKNNVKTMKNNLFNQLNKITVQNTIKNKIMFRNIHRKNLKKTNMMINYYKKKKRSLTNKIINRMFNLLIIILKQIKIKH